MTTADARPAAPRAPTVTLRYLRALPDYLQRHGHDPAAIAGVAALLHADADARISEREAAALFAQAAQAIGDDALGLHVGEQIRPGHYGALGYAAMSCATLAEALVCQQRYQSLVLDIAAPQVEMRGDALSLSWQPDSDASYRQLAECNFAGMLSFMRWLTGHALRPLRVDLTYPAPADTREHHRILGDDLVFAADAYRIVVPQAWLMLPLIQPDPEMRAQMQARAEQQLAALRATEDDLLDRARQLIAARLAQGPVELGSIAAQLPAAPRTLQRQLQARQSSFSQLVDEVRAALAERYLADPDLDLTDIAFLLGYSEHSAFTRAYRRWTGRAPVIARRQAASR